MRKYCKKLFIVIAVNLCVLLIANISFAQSSESIDEHELLMKYGNNLENPPFEVRKAYYEKTNSSWRYLIYPERKKFFIDWLSTHPEELADKKQEKDPALINEPTVLQKKYGLYLENAPYKARLDFINSHTQSWNDTGYLEKNDFLQNWIELNKTNIKIDEKNIPEDITNIISEIHRKYGKDLSNAPFDARVEYFQTYNQSWRDVDYLDRKNFILDWYQRNQEKLEKFKAQLKAELEAKFANDLERMKMVELDIPKSFGKGLDDVPFELKRQYLIDTGNSWHDASLEIREVYAKKWLVENKDVFEKEIERSKQIYEKEIEVYTQIEQNKEKLDRYKEEIARRAEKRKKEAEKKKKEEEKRKRDFKKKVAQQKKKVDLLRQKSDKERSSD